MAATGGGVLAHSSIKDTVCLYFIYRTGFNIWHSLVDVIAVYTLLVVCGGTVLSVALTWIITMVHI